MTVVDWIDLFTRPEQKKQIVDALHYCTVNKGLEIYGWCLMPSHLHLIANAVEPFQLSAIIRDFKRHTSKTAIEVIQSQIESRRNWLLNRFEFAGRIHPKNKGYKVWQDKNHAIELFTEKVTWQKLHYIHRNPVVNQIVAQEQDYLYSSARNYYNLSNVLEISCLTPPVITSYNRHFFNS
jgi:REP element-mobilizing transposase RayT